LTHDEIYRPRPRRKFEANSFPPRCLALQKVPRPRFGATEILPHLLAGKSLLQIANETGVKLASVHSAANRAYRLHGVTTREAFARVTKSPLPPPDPRPTPRRDEVKRRLLAGESYKQIADAMSITPSGVGVVANKIYRMHGVRSRRELQSLVRTNQQSYIARTGANHDNSPS
jgi:DNA-binding NarL/FixJ family response regulator